MNLKMLSTLSVKSVAIAIVAVHALPLLFILYADTILTHWLPCLFVVLLPLLALLYTPILHPTQQNTRLAGFKIIGIALLSLITLFLIGYFSTTFQPPIKAGEQAVAWVVLPGAENMAYVLRLFLQAWLFAMVCVMAGRWLTVSPHVSGFLSRFYPKKDLLPWILDLVLIGSTVMLLTVILVFACQQLFYVLSRMIGVEHLFAFPQLNIFVFLFSLFIVNKATSFSTRIVNYAKKPHAPLALVYLGFIGYVGAVWIFSQMALWGLPDPTQHELAQALNIGFASLAGFERNWPLLVMSCSFFMVAPLTVLLSRLLASGSRFAFIMALASPLGIASCFLVLFPSVNAAFWSWLPSLHFSTVAISDALVQFHFNGFSVMLLGLVLILLCVMGKGSLFMQTLVALSPTALGRRERRVKENIAKYLKLICFMYGVFGLLGVYGLALNVGIYLPTVVTACAVLIGLAIHTRFQKRLPTNVCMEVK